MEFIMWVKLGGRGDAPPNLKLAPPPALPAYYSYAYMPIVPHFGIVSLCPSKCSSFEWLEGVKVPVAHQLLLSDHFGAETSKF